MDEEAKLNEAKLNEAKAKAFARVKKMLLERLQYAAYYSRKGAHSDPENVLIYQAEKAILKDILGYLESEEEIAKW